MENYYIGDLVFITHIESFTGLRDADAGKIGVIVGIFFDWAIRSDILYIQVEGKRKGFYPAEVEVISSNGKQI